MPEDERQLRPRQLAVADVQVRAAHAAGVDAQQHLPRTRHWRVDLGRAEDRPGASRSIAFMVQALRTTVSSNAVTRLSCRTTW